MAAVLTPRPTFRSANKECEEGVERELTWGCLEERLGRHEYV